jgi:3-deoxy-D-manno-octulosonate 8-phosphate phosphatase (KDO 8-P phosphatase)
LTDGRITLLSDGDEQKSFHVRDGQGIVLLHKAGLRTGIISGRSSRLVERRAKELGIEFVRQGVWNKLEDFAEILEQTNLKPDETAFIGDDITDIPLMLRVGFAAAVADAVTETKKAAHLVTKEKGGHGAVREVTDLILQIQGKWQQLMSGYFNLLS